MRDAKELRVFVGPEQVPVLEEAVLAGGAALSGLREADAIIYYGDDDPETLRQMMHDGVQWVQLPHAGIEPWTGAGLVREAPVFTCAAGMYGEAVAEHALALMLAAARGLATHAMASEWRSAVSHSFAGSTVAIIGAGGIGAALARIMAPFSIQVNVVSDRPVDFPVVRRVPRTEYRSILHDADYLVLAAPATPETAKMISTQELHLMKKDSWLINVARGELVDTGALVDALTKGDIGGAALDVTDPEPLPQGHPLWELPNVLITPHCANTRESYWRGLAERTRNNVRHIVTTGGFVGLEGRVVPSRGY
ncbi:NAD(P)-dependent oxidoreductase [Saxibacter everestensis]|uniref:NAD(P)-dependent oxidoreductase n=1 Tax=Saxibacter everestensis TaxID=2909229 RepID=A0ABY8QWX3_9MICO|nr:NAD(P)-dependent oxidoreductase [Brevibacteriaceae bacterium ZFBP1038]